MSQFVAYLIFVVLRYLSSRPGSIIIISGQGQEMDINLKVLDRGGDQQCASAEERERAICEIRQIVDSAILTTTGHIHTCNGAPLIKIN